MQPAPPVPERMVFTAWMQPETMSSMAHDARVRLTPTLFWKNEYKHLREAITASDFCAAYAPSSSVRLPIEDGDCDFEVQRDGHVESYQAVEIVDPDTRRGDPRSDEMRRVDFDYELAVAVEGIARAVARKAQRTCPPPPGLVIRMNLWVNETLGLDRAAALVSAWRDRFASIWMLCPGSLLYLLAPDKKVWWRAPEDEPIIARTPLDRILA